MTTTPNPTAEQIVAEAMVNAGAPLMHSRVEEAVCAALRTHGLLSGGAPTDDAVRDAVDHVRGAVEFQDAISPEAVRVLTDAVILARPLIQDPAVTALVAEAREWAKYDSTGASKIVIELCAALTAAGVAPQEPRCEHGIALIDLCQFADHVANDESVPLDPEKVAEVVQDAISEYMRKHSDWNCGELGYPGSMKHFITDALSVRRTRKGN